MNNNYSLRVACALFCVTVAPALIGAEAVSVPYKLSFFLDTYSKHYSACHEQEKLEVFDRYQRCLQRLKQKDGELTSRVQSTNKDYIYEACTAHNQVVFNIRMQRCLGNKVADAEEALTEKR